MRLFNYTIIFLIVFGAMVFITDRKAYLEEASSDRQILFENACSDGVKAAASVLASENADSPAVESAFFSAMAARLGVEMQPFYQEKLEWYVPLICILRNDSFELIYTSFDDEGKYYRRSHGRIPYGSSESEQLYLTAENAEQCIVKVEKAINAVISGWLFPDGDERVCFDLPEYTTDAYVRNISGPSVLAVSADRAFGSDKRRYAVYAAELSNARELVVYDNNGRKEMHYSDCERILSKKVYRISDYKEAAILGAFPAPCCDPLGAYCFDFCGYD